MSCVWDAFNTSRPRRGRAVEENPDDLCLREDLQVRVLSILEQRVDGTISCILADAILTHVSLPSLRIS